MKRKKKKYTLASVPVRDIKTGPIKHAKLAKRTLDVLSTAHQLIDRWSAAPAKFSEFCQAFQHDRDPHKEASLWLAMGVVFQQFFDCSPPEPNDRTLQVFSAILSHSLGKPSDKLGVPKSDADRIAKLWKRRVELLEPTLQRRCTIGQVGLEG